MLVGHTPAHSVRVVIVNILQSQHRNSLQAGPRPTPLLPMWIDFPNVYSIFTVSTIYERQITDYDRLQQGQSAPLNNSSYQPLGIATHASCMRTRQVRRAVLRREEFGRISDITASPDGLRQGLTSEPGHLRFDE